MMKLYLFITLLGVASASFVPKNGYEVLWSDEFDGNELNRTLWTVQAYDNKFSKTQLQHFVDDNTTIVVNNGTLSIVASNPGGVVFDGSNYDQTYYTSGRISTRNKTSWYPGMTIDNDTWNKIRIEARINTINQTGFVNAFWMLPNDPACPGDYEASGEIDIMESIMCSTAAGGLWVKNDTDVKKENLYFKAGDDEVCNTYYDYAIEWDANGIAFFVDEEQYGFVGSDKFYSPCDPSTGVPYNRPFYIILNVNVGGQWAGPPPDGTRFPTSMDVDYVRVSGMK